MTSRNFESYGVDDAPAEARTALRQSRERFGRVPSPLARLAAAPSVLREALDGLEAFERSTLSPVEREVLAMTMARKNSCHYCRALHKRLLHVAGAPPDVAHALEHGTPLESPRLETLRRFVLSLLDTSGDPSDATWGEFLAAGFDRVQALEIVQGIAAYTLTTFANRLIEAPLDV